MDGITRNAIRIKATQEIFTPTEMVQNLLDTLDSNLFIDEEQPFVDPTCGDGQFLGEVLIRKLEQANAKREWQEKVKNSLGEYVSLEEKAKQFAEDFETALSTIYGVEMQEDNIKLCQDRLLCGQEHLRHIVEKNIVCENALDCDYSFGEPFTLGPNGLITFE
jgi:hypothetical protein